MLYALKSPSGRIVEDSVSRSRTDVIFHQFELLASTDPNYRSKYWKRLDAGNRAAKRRGWRIVPVTITEV